MTNEPQRTSAGRLLFSMLPSSGHSLVIGRTYYNIIYYTLYSIACMQTSPISFVALLFPFPRATKEIGDVCTQAIYSIEVLLGCK